MMESPLALMSSVFATVPSVRDWSGRGRTARIRPSESRTKTAQSVWGWTETDGKDGRRRRSLSAHNKNYKKIISITILTVMQDLWAYAPSILFLTLFLQRLHPLHQDFIHSEACITLSGLIGFSLTIYSNRPMTVDDGRHSVRLEEGRRRTGRLRTLGGCTSPLAVSPGIPLLTSQWFNAAWSRALLTPVWVLNLLKLVLVAS